METGIAKRAGTLMQQRRPSQSLSVKSEILRALTLFSLRRSAAVNPETLALFSSDLSKYSLEDVEGGLAVILSDVRRDGEAAFPELPRFVQAIRKFREDRASTAEIRRINKEIEHYRAHPEEYISDEETNEMVSALTAKFDMNTLSPGIDTTPVMEACPKCGFDLPVARNMRFWDPDEIEAYAKLLREVRAVAAANREIALAELQARLAGQVAGDVK